MLMYKVPSYRLKISGGGPCSVDAKLLIVFSLNRFAARTGRKVSRAFSFNRSPSRLKRAVSTVMSPFANSGHLSLRGATSVNNLAVSIGFTFDCPNFI